MERCRRLPDPNEVHVWFVELASGDASHETRLALSADERERAARFRFADLAAAFTLARGTLRAMLGRYLNVEPDLIRFAYGPRGKPRLAFPETPLRFNVSHSGAFAAYAFALDCEVGVDIEAVLPAPERERVVRRFFSREESEEWLRLDPAQRDDAFYRCWTRKEAYIKALGGGLSVPLDSFRVSMNPGAPAALVHAEGDPAAARRWSLYSLSPPEGYIASLAVPERGRRVRILPAMTAAAVREWAAGLRPLPPAAALLA